MEKRELRQRLEELHRELQEAEPIDPAALELLRKVMEDIRRQLEAAEQGSEADPESESLIDRLRDAVNDFEESHPALTDAAGRVIDTLARIGI